MVNKSAEAPETNPTPSILISLLLLFNSILSLMSSITCYLLVGIGTTSASS